MPKPSESKHCLAESVIHVKKSVKLKNAVMVVGLPGIGLVSKLAADTMVRQLNAEHFATLYSPHFPNQVMAFPSGKLKPFVLKFYYKKLGKSDLVIMRGDLQPITIEGQYEVCSKALNFFKDVGGSQVVAMAGYAIQKKTEKPRVFCASTGAKLFNEFKRLGAKTTDSIVPIVGMAGLVPALASLHGLTGCCLLVETTGQMFDPHGASALLQIVGAKLGKKFDASKLESQARNAQQLIEKIESQARDEAAKATGVAPSQELKKDSLSYIR